MPPSKASVAETAKYEAEAQKELALARLHTAEAEYHEIKVDKARREAADDLAADKHHHVYAFNETTSASATRKCIDQLTTWMRQAGDEPLNIEICFNSPGGSVIDGMALWDYIKLVQSKGHHVTTSTVGMAASMAGILLQAGDKRVMGAESYLLIHEVSFGAGGKIGEVEDEVAFVRKIQERVLGIFADRSTLSKRQIQNKWRRKDWWLDSDEALKLGFVDEVR